MAKKKDALEKRRKGVELVFDLMFWFVLIAAIFQIISFFQGNSKIVEVIVSLVSVGILFVGARLAHSGNMMAGVLGIIVGAIEFFAGGLLFNILGALLVIDSVMFLVTNDKK